MKPHNPNTIPAADMTIAHLREMENDEAAELRREICKRFSDARDKTSEGFKKVVLAANTVREVGVLVMKYIDLLPGKQLTIDFYKQRKGDFVDAHGQPISRDSLLWAVRMAKNEPEPIPDPAYAIMGYRREQLALIGYTLKGEAPSREPAPAENHFALVLAKIDAARNDWKKHIDALEEDGRFGPIRNWEPEQARLMLGKVNRARQELDKYAEELAVAAGKEPES